MKKIKTDPNDIRQYRLQFNSLRAGYMQSGRLSALYGMSMSAAISLGYALESYFKQGLIELGVKNLKLQYSHDLKLLLEGCQNKGLYNDLKVSDDFMAYADSLFQMRYPSSTTAQALKAYERGNVIAAGWDFLLAYDDLFIRLDQDLLSYTNDFLSSSVIRICCNADANDSRVFFHHNLYVFKDFERLQALITQNYPNNKSALTVLSEGPDALWNNNRFGPIFYISRQEALLQYPNPAKDFVFPGEVIRNANGQIIALRV